MRINRHQMFMEIAQVVAKRSTCFRESVGAVIVKDKKVISIGYNGAPAGEPHCKFHDQGKCTISVHAETNAIRFAYDAFDVGDQKGDLYVTHLPCLQCAERIIGCQFIKRVFFQVIYGDATPIYNMLDDNFIQLFRVLPSGTITSWNREEILDVQT